MTLSAIMDICKEVVYKAIFLKYVNSIHNYIFAKSGNHSLSEDVVQNVFLKLWQKCSEIRYKTVKQWLYRTAENFMINELRHKKVVLVHKKNQKVKNISIETPQYQLEEKEFKEKVERIIDNMPEKSKVVFLLSRIEQLTYKEIALRLGLSQKAIEKRMGIALEIFRNGISEENK